MPNDPVIVTPQNRTYPNAIWDGVVNTTQGIIEAISHPSTTAEAIITLPLEVGVAIAESHARSNMTLSVNLQRAMTQDITQWQALEKALNELPPTHIEQAYDSMSQFVTHAQGPDYAELITSFVLVPYVIGRLGSLALQRVNLRQQRATTPFLFEDLHPTVNHHNDPTVKIKFSTPHEVNQSRLSNITYIFAVSEHDKFRIARRCQPIGREGAQTVIVHSDLFPLGTRIKIAGEHYRGNNIPTKTNNFTGHFNTRYIGIKSDIRKVFTEAGIDPGKVQVFYIQTALEETIKSAPKNISGPKLFALLEEKYSKESIWYPERNSQGRRLAPNVGHYIRKYHKHIDPITGGYRNPYSKKDIQKFVFEWRQQHPHQQAHQVIEHLEQIIGPEHVWEPATNAAGKSMQAVVASATSLFFLQSSFSGTHPLAEVELKTSGQVTALALNPTPTKWERPPSITDTDFTFQFTKTSTPAVVPLAELSQHAFSRPLSGMTLLPESTVNDLDDNSTDSSTNSETDWRHYRDLVKQFFQEVGAGFEESERQRQQMWSDFVKSARTSEATPILRQAAASLWQEISKLIFPKDSSLSAPSIPRPLFHCNFEYATANDELTSINFSFTAPEFNASLLTSFTFSPPSLAIGSHTTVALPALTVTTPFNVPSPIEFASPQAFASPTDIATNFNVTRPVSTAASFSFFTPPPAATEPLAPSSLANVSFNFESSFSNQPRLFKPLPPAAPPSSAIGYNPMSTLHCLFHTPRVPNNMSLKPTLDFNLQGQP